MTEKIRNDAEAKIKGYVEQGTARAHRAEADRKKAKELLFQMESSMKQLKEELQAAQARAAEDKRRALAEKDAVITQISHSLMEQGSDLARVERERDAARAERDQAQVELEGLRAKVNELKASSRSNAEALATLEAEKGQLGGRLQEELQKNEDLRRDVNTWAQREANLPLAVAAKYVKSAEFKDFVERLTVGAFRMGALEYRKAILEDHPVSLVEAADRAVLANLTEPELSGVPHPPQFVLSAEDYDREVEEGTFEDPPEAEAESEEEETEGGIPLGEPSILDALADDPLDPPGE